ncbi:unnamed protein product [Linum trigynum]|uniref:DUF4283 domain-containing protein n=1 Tax=Linum trigynum TaxID=586398 RepID=A0AAV2CRY5_9ROSI
MAVESAVSGAEWIPVKPWAELFGIAEANRLAYIPPEVFKGGIRMPKIVCDEGAARWKHSLVGQFLHPSPPPLSKFRHWANKLWGRDGIVRVSLLGNQLILIQLPTQETCDWILKSGSWFYSDNLIYLRPWTPGNDVEDLGNKALPIWVKFTNVPLEYINFQGMSRMGSWLGIPLGVDHTTRMGGRLGCAKALVELKASGEFPNYVLVWPTDDRSIRVGVAYSHLPPICGHCQSFGLNCGCGKNERALKDKGIQESREVERVWVRKKAVGGKTKGTPNHNSGSPVTMDKGKSVVSDSMQHSRLLIGSNCVGINLEHTFQSVAECSSPQLPTEDEFQKVVNGARLRCWLPLLCPTSVLQTTQSFAALQGLGDREITQLQAAPKKGVRKGGGSQSPPG